MCVLEFILDEPGFVKRHHWKYNVYMEGGDAPFDTLMDEMGRAIVREALHMTNGNRSRAARLLGMSRPTLLARMEKYGLKVETLIS